MDIQAVVFGTLGGLAIFLFGMKTMSEGLRNIGSETFKNILKRLTQNRLWAVLVGMGITCCIQSSSATSVMVVGFVNAGLLELQQAIAVVLGADIGTTITAWVVSAMGVGKFKITAYALPVIAAGFLTVSVSKRRKPRMIGQTLFGFGLLFLGLGTMSEGVKSIKESVLILEFFADFGSNAFLGILAGTLVTMFIQSSSATIAIIQVMALQGIFGLEAALPLMFGADIGTTITAQLAAIGGTRNARGVAMANTFFKLVGVVLFVPFYLTGYYTKIVRWVIPDSINAETGANGAVMAQIAIAHTAYIAVAVILFSTLLWPLLVRFSQRFSTLGPRTAETEDEELIYLDPLLLNTPPVALDQCVWQLGYMTRQCRKNLDLAFEGLLRHDLAKESRIRDREERIDSLQKDITAFLVDLSRRELNMQASRAIPLLIHCINDAERIGDHAEDLVELTRLAIDDDLKFSEAARQDLRDCFDLVQEQFDTVLHALRNTGAEDPVQRAQETENRINAMYVEVSNEHVRRLEKEDCSIPTGVLFLDVMAHLEEIGDQLLNIAQRVRLNSTSPGEEPDAPIEEDRIGR